MVSLVPLMLAAWDLQVTRSPAPTRVIVVDPLLLNMAATCVESPLLVHVRISAGEVDRMGVWDGWEEAHMHCRDMKEAHQEGTSFMDGGGAISPLSIDVGEQRDAINRDCNGQRWGARVAGIGQCSITAAVLKSDNIES